MDAASSSLCSFIGGKPALGEHAVREFVPVPELVKRVVAQATLEHLLKADLQDFLVCRFTVINQLLHPGNKPMILLERHSRVTRLVVDVKIRRVGSARMIFDRPLPDPGEDLLVYDLFGVLVDLVVAFEQVDVSHRGFTIGTQRSVEIDDV